MSGNATEKRRHKLAEMLISEGSLRVGVLSERLGVSTETIRKDLLSLEEKGIVRKSHGSAVPASTFLEIERSMERKSHENTEIKNRIAQAAAELIPERGMVLLDTGSTVYSLARLLYLKKGLHIFTNAVTNVQAVAGSDNEIYLIGGKFRSTSMASVGMWGMDILSSINADIVFLGTDGFAGSSGPCTASYDEAEVKTAMIRAARTRVVVSDSSKMSITSLFKFCDWSMIDHLITDGDVDAHTLDKLRNQVNVIVV